MKRICILMLSLVILFASYSCAQKTGTGPKGKEYTLKLAVDYYGNMGAIDSNAISVKVYKTKEDVESEEVESEYTGLDFADETKPVSIIENYEVVITLNKTLDGDSTYISGDVPDEFDSTSGELQFTMDGDKTFSITFSKAPIKKIKYTFKVGLNGGINVAVEGGANYNIGANSSREIEFLETEIKASKVKATANPNTFYLFDKWSYNNSIDNPLTITADMAGTITANFIEDARAITFNFKSGPNGDIYLNFLNRSTGKMISNKIIAANTSFYTTLTESLLTSQKVEARASGNFVNPNYYVIDKWSDNSALEVREINLSSPKTLSVSFKTGTINYGTGTAPKKVGDWYEIWNKDELIYVAKQVSAESATFQSGKYKLMADIDYNKGYHLPIGSASATFNGIINGNKKTIRNAKFGMSGSGLGTYTGFIGYLGRNGVVSNLIIDSSCTIDSSADNVGSIVAHSDGSIYNSVNKADIKAYASTSVGGIVGILFSTCTISNVYNTGDIYVDSSAKIVCVGGVFGYSNGLFNNDTLYLKNAYNTGDITYNGSSARPYIGGVLGAYANIYITNVYNTGEITNLGSSSTATNYTGGVFGLVPSSATFQAANVYFTGNKSLPAEGFGSSSPIESDANVFGRIGSLSELENKFNKAIPNSWYAGTDGRPRIKGLPTE